MSLEGYDVAESVKAQKEYCKRTSNPHFAPSSGVCWSCKKNIYEGVEKEYKQEFGAGKGKNEKYISGISTEKAGNELVTGCPHCHRSYCD